jgi:hypothetical protein
MAHHLKLKRFLQFGSLLGVNALGFIAFNHILPKKEIHLHQRTIASSATECSALIEPPLTFANLKNRIERCGINNVEGVLAVLPESFRSSFTLMRKSKSAQEASSDHPRAILFGTDARLILTFNGDPAQKGFDELEAIEFDDEAKRFDFHQISFNSILHSKPIFDLDIHSCTTCHRSPARPNWEAYDVWEGAYGQVEDQIKIGSKEDGDFQHFLKNFRTEGRYKYLIGPEGLRAPSIAVVAGDVPSSKATAFSVATLPNFRLTFLLNLLNYRRIANEIKKTPNFETFKYAYYGALFGCGPIEDFIPAEISSKFSQKYNVVLQDTLQKIVAQYSVRLKKDGPFDSFGIFNQEQAPQNFEATSSSRFIIAKLRYLTEGRNISMADWSLSPNPDAYIFSDGELYLKEVARSFENELSKIPGLKLDYVRLDEADTEILFGTHAVDFKGMKRMSCCNYDSVAATEASESYRDNNCSILKKLSVDSFRAQGAVTQTVVSDQFTPNPEQGFHRVPAELINTCVSCHRVDNGSGLLFSSAAELESLMTKTGFPHGTLRDEMIFRLSTDGPEKMPPYSSLMSNGERQSLLKYLTHE